MKRLGWCEQLDQKTSSIQGSHTVSGGSHDEGTISNQVDTDLCGTMSVRSILAS